MWGDKPARGPAPKAPGLVAAPAGSPFLAQLGQPFSAVASSAGRPTLVLQTGIKGKITDVAWSPNRDCVAFAADDGTVTLVDPRTGEIKRTVQGALGAADAVEFSGDGKELVTAGGSDSFWVGSFGHCGRTRVWDRNTGRMVQDISSFGSPVTSVHFSPDGRMLAMLSNTSPFSDGYQGTVAIWKANWGSHIQWLIQPNDDAVAMGFSSGGQTLDVRSIPEGSESGPQPNEPSQFKVQSYFTSNLQLYGTFSQDSRKAPTWLPASDPDDSNARPEDTFALENKLSEPLSTFDALAAGTDGTLAASYGPGIAALDRPDNLTLWDLKTGRLTHSLAFGGGPCQGIALSPDNRFLAALGATELTLWRRSNYRHPLTANLTYGHGQVQFAPDSRSLLVSSGLELWKVSPFQPARHLTWHKFAADSALFSPNGRYVAAVGDEDAGDFVFGGPHGLVLWNLLTGKAVAKQDGDNAFGDLGFTPDSRTLFAPRTMDVISGRFKSGSPESQVDDLGYAYRPRLNPMGTSAETVPDLAKIGVDGTVSIQNSAKGPPLSLDGSKQVTALAYTPDGSKLTTLCKDGVIRIWSARNYKLLASLQILAEKRDLFGNISDDWITTTPDGYYIGSPGAEQYIRWNVNGRLYPAAAFHDRFCRPDLVVAALRG